MKKNKISISKRSVERLISDIEWLRTSGESKDQYDRHGKPGVKTVFSFLLSEARRKRRKVHFAGFIDIARRLDTGADDSSESSTRYSESTCFSTTGWARR